MPYIFPERQEYLGEQLSTPRADDVGELTFLLTTMVERYRAEHRTSFETLAEIVAALEQTKDEFQRRVVHPYEDMKRCLNGDVYAPLESIERTP